MEERKKTDGGLYKVRGYLNCLNEGFKLPTRHIISLLRFTYPSLLTCVVVAALCGLFFTHLSTAFAEWLSSTGSMVLHLPLLSFILLVFLFLLADSFYVGNVLTAVVRYGEEGAWPVLQFRSLVRDIIRMSFKVFTCSFIALLLLVIVIIPLCYGPGVDSIWFYLILSLLYMLVGIPYTMISMDYVMESERRNVNVLTRIKETFRYWGVWFVVLFCSGMLVALLIMVVWMPAAVLAYADHASTMAVLTGDPTDLPAFVPWLTVLFFMLSALLTGMVRWLLLFPVSYLYASIETRRKEQELFEKEEREV